MKLKKPIASLSHLPDARLQTVAKEIVTTIAESPSQPVDSFTSTDVTKAIGNFNTAVANAKDGDKTAVAIRDLAKEALLSVLSNICGHYGLSEKYRIGQG